MHVCPRLGSWGDVHLYSRKVCTRLFGPTCFHMCTHHHVHTQNLIAHVPPSPLSWLQSWINGVKLVQSHHTRQLTAACSAQPQPTQHHGAGCKFWGFREPGCAYCEPQ